MRNINMVIIPVRLHISMFLSWHFAILLPCSHLLSYFNLMLFSTCTMTPILSIVANLFSWTLYFWCCLRANAFLTVMLHNSLWAIIYCKVTLSPHHLSYCLSHCKSIFGSLPNIKSRSLGPLLIWTNITIVVNVFQEILALMTVRHIVSSKRVTVQTQM